jgi:hypothetical protein
MRYELIYMESERPYAVRKPEEYAARARYIVEVDTLTVFDNYSIWSGTV